MEKYLNVTKKLAKKAGDELLSLYKNRENFTYSSKSKGEIVSQADHLAEEIIIRGIQESFPDHNIYSEESGVENNQSDYTWIIDPLDGTTNFVFNLHFWNVSIALMHKGNPIIGVIYAPMYNEFYTAVDGGGAYCNDVRIEIPKDDKLQFDKSLHGYCYGDKLPAAKPIAADYYKRMLLSGYSCRQLGSAALELGRVSGGMLGSMYIPGANTYDVAAGVLLIKEAGGVIVDQDGEEWKLKSDFLIAGREDLSLIHI